MKPRLYVKQKITAYVNRYRIIEANEDGTEGGLIGLAQQKRFARREKVFFYSDDTREKVAYSFRAEKVLDIHGKYFVEDASGKLIGVFKKEFAKSLLKSTWSILDKNDTVLFTVTDSNTVLALLRRFVGEIPIVGGIAELIIMFFKYHFVISDNEGNEVGRYEKKTIFRDYYLLSVTDGAWDKLDKRVFASVGVALDALQSR